MLVLITALPVSAVALHSEGTVVDVFATDHGAACGMSDIHARHPLAEGDRVIPNSSAA